MAWRGSPNYARPRTVVYDKIRSSQTFSDRREAGNERGVSVSPDPSGSAGRGTRRRRLMTLLSRHLSLSILFFLAHSPTGRIPTHEFQED